MIADMIANKKLSPIVTELFIRGRKLNISLGFITQSYFKIPKYVRLNCTHLFITKIPHKQGIQKITFDNLLQIFIKMYCETLFIFMIDTTLKSNYVLCFRNNILERT